MVVAVTSKSFSKNEHLINELKKHFDDIRLNLTGHLLEGDELINFLKDCDGIIVALEQMTPEVINQLPKLKIISKFGVGLNNIDLEYCKQKNIKIGWSAGVNKTSVAEMTLGFMLMLIRNLYITSNKLSNGTWDKDGGFSLYGKTIGVIGVGHIGKELINLLKPFGCIILVNDIINQDSYYEQNGLVEVNLQELISRSDIITVHTPLTKDTNQSINKNVFDSMKDTAFIINTARGEIVNLTDLKEALKFDKIAGAAIDVYDSEPPKHKELLSLPNLICTPHIGGNSKEAVLAMGMSAIKNLKDFCNGNN
jgi:D-3-phosphoglycerate dehydrogenase